MRAGARVCVYVYVCACMTCVCVFDDARIISSCARENCYRLTEGQ